MTKEKESAELARLTATNAAHLQLALTSSGMGLWRWEIGPDKRVFDTQTCQILGIDASAFRGTPDEFFCAVHPDDRAPVREALRKAIELDVQYEVEYRAIHADESVHYVSARGRCVRNSEGQPVSIQGVLWDCTERRLTQQALHKNEALQRAMIANISDVIAVIDREGVIRFKSPNIEKWFGWQPEDLVGTSALANIHPDEQQHLHELFSSFLSQPGGAVTGECRYRCKDGRYKWIELTAVNLIHDPDIGGVLLNYRDISERKQAELALRESEERSRSLVDNANEAIYVVQGSKVVFSNSVGVELSGYSEQELASKPFVEFIHPDDRAMVAERRARRLKGEQLESHYTFRVINKKGDIKWVQLGAALITYKEEPATLNLIADITERKQAEQDLQNLNQFNLEVIGGAAEGIVVYDRQACYRVWNPFMETLTGVPACDVLGQCAFSVFPHLREQDVDQLIERALAGETVHSQDVPFYTPGSGRSGWVAGSYAPHRDGNGDIVGVVATIQDVTERKKAESALREQHAELERFSYAVSHDLKSPLITIKTFLAYLETDLQDNNQPGVNKDLEFIRNAADRMSQLLDELTNLSRVGRVKNPNEEVLLQQVVREALDLVAGRIAQRGATVKVTEEPVLLCGDRRRLVELFQNLLDNAAKFTQNQGFPEVEVGVESTGEGLRIFVRDNGVGFRPEQKEKLFGLFQRFDPSSEGSGIGLALARRIVLLHGGKIWAESDGPGKGATFKFTLASARRASRVETLS